MCGIAGIVEPVSRGNLNSRWEQAAHQLKQRGPDTKRFQVADLGPFRCLLGHRRLKIVDTSSYSDQPMSKAGVDMVFNGEIYNFRQLRDGLVRQGVKFGSSGDSEVLLSAFIEDGLECFRSLDGMWAVAFLDRNRETITLCRDFFGEKPLYYLFDGEVFVFASNILALSKLYSGNLRLNNAYLDYFLHSGYAPANCCVFEGVHKLEAGQVLTYNIATRKVKLEDQPPLFRNSLSDTSESFSIKHFDSLFTQSLHDRLLADVPVGLMLSGGIDSSYVATVARYELDYRLDCLTVKYGRGSDVETDRAVQVASILGIPHTVVDVPETQLEGLIEASIPSMDEPISDVAYPLLLRIVGATPDSIRVLLNGDGADELFLSYVNYRRYLTRLGCKPTVAGTASVAGACLLSTAPDTLRRIWRKLTSRLPMSAPQMLETDLALHRGQWQLNRMPTGYTSEDQLLTLYRHAYMNNLSEYLTVKSDRASMWHSKEFRTPFLNNDLLEYIGNCDLASLPRGEKTPLVEQLNLRLGRNLGFSKRGMFAKGETAFLGLRLPSLTKFGLPTPRTPQQYYRALILSKWIKYHLEEYC